MSKPTRRLGRGLASLIQPTKPADDAAKIEVVESETSPSQAHDPDDALPHELLPSLGLGEDHEADGQRAPLESHLGREAAAANFVDRSSPDRQMVADRRTVEVLPTAANTEVSTLDATDFIGGATSGAAAATLRVDAIRPGKHQPRQQFDRKTIASLAASIARNGLIQPLVVRPIRMAGDESQHVVGYELIAGERRWRASKAAGIDEVPVIIRNVDDERSLELALVENLQREDLNAIDRAEAYERYCEEFGLRPEEVARRLNEDRTTVVNYLRLLELPPQVKELVAEGQLSMGHARSILGVEGTQRRCELAQAAVANGLSVRALEEIVRRKRLGRDVTQPADQADETRKPAGPQANVADLENRFQQALATKVKIKPGRGKGRGRIVIDYFSLDDFDRIAGKLGVHLD
ncbi:MAG: ParB/RepB/Spo0J family partition protein [Phycisphaerales bacterium]|nr:ParB/RepB/Spo0J family partition protein [Phycisphaerales bacterium]